MWDVSSIQSCTNILMSRSTLIIKPFRQHIFFFYVPVSNKNEKKKEKDLYKNENDKISTEREKKNDIPFTWDCHV